MSLDEAKVRLRIPDLWAMLNLPGDCRNNPCHSPFYERTSRPAFSIFDDGRAFKDHRTDAKGSAVDFLILATALSRSAACVKFIELAGGRRCDARVSTPRTAPAPQAPRPAPTLPPMDSGTDDELRQLAALRHLDCDALRIALGAGLLRFAILKGHRAWILTDAAALNAQARRLDGKPWEHLDGAKSFTLPGCWAGFPLGVAHAQNYAALMLCEGGPDFLAAFHFIANADRLADICPIAMLGANQRIHEAALPMLAGKRVVIYAHADAAGQCGAERWREQLHSIGATVEKFDFKGLLKADGSPVKDLNDCTQIHADDSAELADLLP